MRTIRKPFNNENSKATITGIFDVFIPLELWQKMNMAKNKNTRLTFSWISRYCLFRLLRNPRFFAKAKFKKLFKEEKHFSKKPKDCHRHSICLYGEDEQWIKNLSLHLRINVSKLVRIALLWYLDELLQNEIPMLPMQKNVTKSIYKKYGKPSFQKIKDFGTKVNKKWISYRVDYRFWVKELHAVGMFFVVDDFW